HNVFPATFGSQEDYVDRFGMRDSTQLPAYLDPIHLWHHPVKDGQSWSFLSLQRLAGFRPVRTGYDFVTPFDQRTFQHTAGNQVIFGNQYSHFASSSPCRMSSKNFSSSGDTILQSAASQSSHNTADRRRG